MRREKESWKSEGEMKEIVRRRRKGDRRGKKRRENKG